MKKQIYLTLIGMLFLFLTPTMFIAVPVGHAQSVQDWSDPINLSMSGSASKPSIVVDSDGTLHVFWVDKFDGFKYVQSTDGLTWTAPASVNFPFSVDGPSPVMLSDPNGLIHILWLNDQNKLLYAQTLNETFNAPSTWRKRADIDNNVFDFDVSLDATGMLHVAYVSNPVPTPGTAGSFYRQLASGSNAFTTPTLLYESAYFRSLTAENARIRLAVGGEAGMETVHIVWDDPFQKRIFIVTSMDRGMNWDEVSDLVVPQATLNFRTPYGTDIDVFDDNILVTWFVGEAGIRCTPYSLFSSDGGETWGEQTLILSGSSQCPERSEFVAVESGYSAELLTIQGDLSMIAWDGTTWSNPELQTGPSKIINPATFEPVFLGCEQVTVYEGSMFVVGCDEGSGGDIWFIKRQLDPLNGLFSLPSEWSGNSIVTTTPRTLDSLSSVTDNAGNIHAVWIQSSYLPVDTFPPRIEYSRWNGNEWNNSAPIIVGLKGKPQNLALQIDSQQRLLLSWVNPETGELMFTWSGSERANIPLEWFAPTVLSSSSKLTSSLDMLVDARDRIVIAYAVTLNEDRGIYLIQSTDLGETWSDPVKAFDAVKEGWEMVDQPRLAVTVEGAIHLLFTRYSFRGETHPEGLYYSRSDDGGATWIPAETVNNKPVQWSEIVAYQDTIHRLWQEKNRSVAVTNLQSSVDGGITWGPSLRIPSDAAINSKPSVFLDWNGKLHFLQVLGQDIQEFQEWELAEVRWQLVENKKVSTLELITPPVVEGGITSEGKIYALLQFQSEHPSNDGIETSVLGLQRSLTVADTGQAFLASISTPSASLIPTEQIDLQPIQINASPTLSVLDNSKPRNNKNIIGIILIATAVIFLLVFILPDRKRNVENTRSRK